MAASDVRQAVHEALRRGDIARATRLASEHPEPWYRCQALTAVAAQESDPKTRTRLLDRAFDAADATAEPNRIVTVASWPLAVLDRHGEVRRVQREVARLVAIAQTEPHPIRRMDALSMLRGAVHSEPTASLLDREVMGAALAGHGWKRDALIGGRAIAAAQAGERARALSLLQAIELPRSRRKTARDLAELGLEVPGVLLPNLEERRRLRAELGALYREVVSVHEAWAASVDPYADAELKQRMEDVTERQRQLERELQSARGGGGRRSG